MNHDELGFLIAICAEPWEDTHRLAFADWLDEKGEPDRAELIRVQCEFVRLDQVDRICPFIKEYSRPEPGPMPVERWREGVCQCRGCELVRRERELLKVAKTWLPRGPFTTRDDISAALNICCDFDRGFVSEITCTAADFLAHADALLWLPGQTVSCDGCYVGGASSEPDGYTVKLEHQVWGSYSRTEEYPKKPLCRLCRGKRIVTRPCPPTAQPITRVVLTTLPELEITDRDDKSSLCDARLAGRHFSWPFDYMRERDRTERVRRLLTEEWKGVTFELPAGEPT